MTWRPRSQAGAEHLDLPLDPELGYLLSMLDGTLDIPSLAQLMNLGEDEVTLRLDRLVALGVVASARTAPPAAPETDTPLAADEEVPLPDPDPSLTEAKVTTHRQRFEQVLHHWSVDERVALARQAEEPDLSALCFDPTGEVIRAVLENPQVGGVHARLIAAHHRTAAGLEALGGRFAFTHDAGVRRALLQNPLLPPGLYRRLWSPRRLQEQFLIVASHEVPEQTRALAREQLRAAFNQRPGEERAELILATEGRCLALLTGLTLDSHATALLCRRTYVSTLLIQNLARWSAAPPPLIAHLRRQEVVRRNPMLRQLLERHPNAS